MDEWNNPQSKPYKPYEGPNNKEMPKLIAEGRNHISPSLLFWRKLETLNDYSGALTRGDKKSVKAWKEVMLTWWDKYVDTSFVVARHPDKGVILVPDAQYLKELNLQTKLSEGYAIMPDGMFEKLSNQGHAYSDKEIDKYWNKWLTQKQALSYHLWMDLIPNEDLRNASIVNVFSQYRQRFKKENKLMIISSPDARKEPIMGILSVGGLGLKSNAFGRFLLDHKFGRLVGVLPNVAEGDVRKLEHIIQYSRAT